MGCSNVVTCSCAELWNCPALKLGHAKLENYVAALKKKSESVVHLPEAVKRQGRKQSSLISKYC